MDLSPAFDLNPNPSPGRKHLATAIDEADTTASIRTLMSVAPFFRLHEEEIVAALREVLEATSRWKEVAAQHNIAKLEIERMTVAFEHDETEAARVVTEPELGGRTRRRSGPPPPGAI